MPTRSLDLSFRSSSSHYTNRSDLLQAVEAAVDCSVFQPEPFRRQGYPRAGGIDRLTVYLLPLRENSSKKQPALRWTLGFNFTRKTVIDSDTIGGPSLANLFGVNVPNALILAVGSSNYGQMKYGHLNETFATQEAAIFIQTIHLLLSHSKIPNHFSGIVGEEGLQKLFLLDRMDQQPAGLCV